MLGAIASPEGWRFAAFGKHPGAKDFIRLGSTTPMLEGIADWVDKGYAGIEGKKKGMADAASWRFWSKGFGPGALVCGVVRDSVDGLGRPYPLLVLGTGSLRDWEGHWDLLPYACRPLWQRIEYLGAQRYEEIGRFESAIRGLHPPVPEWTDFSGRRDREVVVSDPEGDGVLPGETSRFIRLDGGAGRDPFPAAVGWQSRLRRDDAETPNAVFFGGTISRAYLGVFRKRLSTPDFVRIWNVTAGEEGPMERGAN
ncbi:MAG: type VI secretion system-associated protein TagF [bacterium]